MKSLEFVELHRNEFEVLNCVRVFDPYPFKVNTLVSVHKAFCHGLAYLGEKEDNIFNHVECTKVDAQGQLPDGLMPVFTCGHVSTHDLNAFNFLNESTFGITVRSEAGCYGNRLINANNLVIKEIEGEPY